MRLFKPAWMIEDWNNKDKLDKALVAVERTTDQVALATIAKTAPLDRVRRAAVRKITDQTILEDVAKAAYVSQEVLDKIADTALLGEILNHELQEPESYSRLKRLEYLYERLDDHENVLTCKAKRLFLYEKGGYQEGLVTLTQILDANTVINILAENRRKRWITIESDFLRKLNAGHPCTQRILAWYLRSCASPVSIKDSCSHLPWTDGFDNKELLRPFKLPSNSYYNNYSYFLETLYHDREDLRLSILQLDNQVVIDKIPARTYEYDYGDAWQTRTDPEQPEKHLKIKQIDTDTIKCSYV